jgi:hypothetical protein
VLDASAGRKIGRFVRAFGRIGRIWRGVCSHDVLTAPSAGHESDGSRRCCNHA